MIASIKLYEKYQDRYHQSDCDFIFRLMTASMLRHGLLINRFKGKTSKFFFTISSNFYNITPSNASFRTVLEKYLFAMQSVQSSLMRNRSEYYLEDFLVNLFLVLSETHSAISWKLSQTWHRLHLSHDFDKHNGDALQYFLTIAPLREVLPMSEITEACEDSMINLTI